MTLYAACSKFGGRPSAWLGVADEVAALSVDLAALKAGLEEEERAAKRAAERARRRR